MPSSVSKITPADQDPHSEEQSQQIRTKKKTFRSKSSIHECREIARRAVSFLQMFTTDRQILFDLELIITEACTNVVFHGYNNDHNGYIEMHLFVENDNNLVIKIVDGGKPFTGPGQEDFTLDPTMESGRGVYIISQLSDSYSYEHLDGQNILRIEKKLRSGAGSA